MFSKGLQQHFQKFALGMLEEMASFKRGPAASRLIEGLGQEGTTGRIVEYISTQKHGTA